MKIMQVYLDMDSLAKAVPYAESIMRHTQSPTFLVNAYFCLMQEANLKNDTRLLSQYSHARADAEKALRDYVSLSAETVSKFSEYLANPYPLRLSSFLSENASRRAMMPKQANTIIGKV